MGQRIKTEGKDLIALIKFQKGLNFLFCFKIKSPDDTGSIISKITWNIYEAVAKVLLSLEKATQLIGSFAALVGLEITSPFSALYTTNI